MSASLEEELRAALDAASEFVHARAGLAERARLSVRSRRRRLAAVIAGTTAVLLVAAGGSYLLAGRHQSAPQLTRQQHRPKSGPMYLKGLPADYQIQQLAVSGRYLYVLTNGPDVLSAYDRVTGKLVHAVAVPGDPTVLAVGPGGLVWFMSTAGSNSGGLWLLSPDLRLHSAYAGLGAIAIVPTGQTTALDTNAVRPGSRLADLPVPGQPGRASAASRDGHRPWCAPEHRAGLLGRIPGRSARSRGDQRLGGTTAISCSPDQPGRQIWWHFGHPASGRLRVPAQPARCGPRRTPSITRRRSRRSRARSCA